MALKGGITLTEIIRLIETETPDPKVKKIFTFFYDRVSSGHPLSECLSNFPDIFSPVYISMVRAGEAGGFLPLSLEEAGLQLKKQAALNRKIKSMLIYPVMLSIIAVGIIVFMSTVVFPVFVQVFSDIHAELPFVTRLLIFTFGLLRGFWYLAAAGAAAAGFFAYAFYRLIGRDATVDGLLFRIPLLGQLMMKIALTRFLSTMTSLLKTSVGILDALNIGKAVAGNTLLAVEIDAIHRAVQAGRPMAEKMANSRFFPSMVSMMVSSGERSGSVPEAMEKVSEYYTEEVDAAIADTLAVLEPLVVLVMGAAVGTIAAGLMLPLFNLPGFLE